MSQHLRLTALIVTLCFVPCVEGIQAEEPASAVVQQVAVAKPRKTADGFTPVPEATPGVVANPFKPEEPAEDSETSKIVNPPAVTIAKPQPKPVAKPENSKPSATAAPVETAPVTTSPATATPSAKVAPETTETPAARVQTVPVEPELSAEMLRLRSKLRRVLGQYYMKPDDTTSHSPWGVMHAFLPFGVDTDILDRGERKNAIAFLAYNGMARGRRLLYTRGGAIHGYQGPGVQGHAGQFLAMLAQSRVKITYPLVVGNEQFTVKDLVRTEMLSCKANTELTFKLIGLSHYLESDAVWRSSDGETWTIQRLIREEMRQPINGAACGGIHRLMGLSYAINRRRKRGEPVNGEWARAQYYVNRYMSYALRMQNRDGSFSTGWFEERGADTDVERRLYTTGHTLEWLVFSAPDHQLDDYRIKNAVHHLANLMSSNRHVDLPIGPKGHALRALALYDQRKFGGKLGLGGGRELMRQAQLSSAQSR